MNFSILKTVILLMMFTPSVRAVTTDDNYFSPEVVNQFKKQQGSNISLLSYANQLLKMHSPSIYQQCLADRQTERYRFLYAASFGTQFAITVERKEAKTSATYTVHNSKATDGRLPGLTEGKVSVTVSEWRRLMQALVKINFFNLDTTAAPLGLDGASWVFEGCRSGKYHLVDRWEPEPVGSGESILALGEQFIRLAKLYIDVRPIILKEGLLLDDVR